MLGWLPCHSAARRRRARDAPPRSDPPWLLDARRPRTHEAELRAAGGRRLSLFGSVARGDAEAGSDVDLVAELDPTARIGMFALAGLEQRLAEIVSRPVDLLPEPVEKPRLHASIERDRVRVF